MSIDSVNRLLQQFFTKASNLFTASLFQVGNASVSIALIFNLIIAFFLVILIARAFKKLLKNRLLLRLGIDEGNREAIATIISYGVSTLGFLIVLQTTGFNVASLAVLAGGLGVGIGFGLQNITNNFVSGITLLLDRSVKVGDFVEIDNIEGYVKAISIRSTIIRTLDGGDVLVPNSHIIQNKLLNWSYESFVGRIRIPVGVADESDLVLVTETLLTSAYMEPAVLHNPAPYVSFMKFGESSLDFELWVWVNRIDQHPKIRSSLNFIIEHNLRKQGIAMPFPQRDLWLRNPEVLIPLVHQNKDSQNMTQLSQQQLKDPPSKPLSVRDLLRNVTYFQNFTDLELRQLIEVGYRKRLVESEILFREDDPGDAFYLILSGSIEVFVEKINKHLNTLYAGQFFGELSLMLGIPRTATVRALEDTILFAINNKGFENLLQQQPELAEVIVQELGKRREELSERQQQLRMLGLVDAAEDDKNPVEWVRKRLKNLFTL